MKEISSTSQIPLVITAKLQNSQGKQEAAIIEKLIESTDVSGKRSAFDTGNAINISA